MNREIKKAILYGSYDGFKIFSPILIAILFLYVTKDVVEIWGRTLFGIAILWGLVGALCKLFGVLK